MIKPSALWYLCTLFIVTPDPTSTGTSTDFFTSIKCRNYLFIYSTSEITNNYSPWTSCGSAGCPVAVPVTIIPSLIKNVAAFAVSTKFMSWVIAWELSVRKEYIVNVVIFFFIIDIHLIVQLYNSRLILPMFFFYICKNTNILCSYQFTISQQLSSTCIYVSFISNMSKNITFSSYKLKIRCLSNSNCFLICCSQYLELIN